jgi:prevent-host-death family protein
MVTKTIPAGEFKAKCLDLMDQVQKKRFEIVVTKRGKPVARVVPVAEKLPDIFGYMKGTVTILGDIMAPIDVEWDVLKD